MESCIHRGWVTRRSSALVALAGLVMPVGMSQAQNAWYWNTGSGAWDLASPNWLQLGLPAAWNDGGTNDAQFAGFLSSGRVVTLSGDRTVGSLAFHGLGGSFYTMGSNSIILNKSLGDDSIAVGRGVLGGASSAAAGGHTVASNLIFNSNLAINNAGTFGLTSLTLSGSISRATAGGSISYTGTGNAVVSGSIDSSVTGGIVKSGKGTLHLSGTNAFTGDVTVDGGVLSFASDAALGAASNSITLNSGGTLRSTGNSTLNPSRAINVAGASRIDMTTGTTLTTSALAGSGAVTLSTTGGVPGGMLALTAPSPSFTGAIRVGNHGVGLVGHVSTQAGAAALGFDRPTTVALAQRSGTTILSLNDGATLTGASSITVNNGALLQINQPTTAITGRLAGVPIAFNNGRFQYNTSANGSVPIADSLSATATGVLTITSTATAGPGLGAGGTSITFDSLVREDHATLAFRPVNVSSQAVFGAGFNRYFVPGTPTSASGEGMTRAVIPWAVQTNSSTVTLATWSLPGVLMVYDAVNGFTAINGTSEQQTVNVANTLAVVPSGYNVRLLSNTSQTIASGGQSIGSAQSSGTTFVGSSASDVLTNNSGAWVCLGATTFNAASVNNPNGAYFHLSNITQVRSSSQFSGPGGLTVSAVDPNTATAPAQMQFTNTPGNTFVGGLYVNGNAGVTFTQNNQLGNDASGLAAGDVVLGGGQLILASAGTTTLADGVASRSIKVNASNGTIGASVAGAVLRVPGVISGSGQVQFGGSTGAASTGVVELTNSSANTYTGGTLISSGVLRISSTNQLGSGDVLFNGGTLQAAGNLSFANAPTLTANSTGIDTQGHFVSFDAGIGGSGGASGLNALNQTLNKTGSGTLIFAGDSRIGSLNINAGSVLINGTFAGVSSGTALTVNAGATLGGFGEITLSTTGAANTLSVLGGGAVAPGVGAGMLVVNADVSLASGSNFLADLNGAASGVGYDVLGVNGAVSLGGASLVPNLNYAPDAFDMLFVLVNDGVDAVGGTFSALPEGASVSLGVFGGVPYSATISYLGDAASGATAGGNDVVLFNIVPAPGVVGFALAAGVFAGRRRRGR